MRTLASFLALAWVGTTFAGDELAAETCVRTAVWDSYADGWGVRTMTSTTLQPGQTRNYLVTLYKGNQYQMRACGEDGAVSNLDLYLYDLAGNVIVQDTTTDAKPMIAYTPTATGTFYIVVHARTLAAGKPDAGVAMAVTYKQ